MVRRDSITTNNLHSYYKNFGGDAIASKSDVAGDVLQSQLHHSKRNSTPEQISQAYEQVRHISNA